VQFATSDGTAVAGADYVATGGTLTFDAGQSLVTFPVSIVSDRLVEGSESFTVALSNPSPGAVLGEPASAAVTITDPAAGFAFSLVADNTGDLTAFPGIPAINAAGAVAYQARRDDENQSIFRPATCCSARRSTRCCWAA
jgi:hypothetical protein